MEGMQRYFQINQPYFQIKLNNDLEHAMEAFKVPRYFPPSTLVETPN